MKKSKLEQVLHRKVRIKITRRKRGRFRVILPAALTRTNDYVVSANFPRKREALVWLYTKLRCFEPITITVEGLAKEVK